jgi:transposase
LRAEVVKAVLESDRGYAQVARDFGLVPETVRTWVKAAKERGSGSTPQAREAIDRARLAELERRVKELEAENAFLAKATAFFARKQR